jgi:hypothetical protein
LIISDTAVKNRISVMVLAVIILIFGTYCYNEIPREDEPDITIPYVFVSTPYKGVAAADIETAITIPIEKKLKGLDRVKNIKSVSSEGVSNINIEFIPKTDIDEVLQKVKDKVDEAKRDLPTDLEDDPAIFEVNLSELPIIVYSISGPCGMVQLKKIADDLEEDIEAIPGVLEVDVTGGQEREIIIEVDPDKLAYYRIPITAFQKVVANENTNTSGGAITLGDGRYQLRVPGEFTTPDEIYGLVVGSFNGKPIYLKDMAKVIDGFKDEESRSRLDGHDAVNIAVKKRAGENIIQIVDAVDRLIEKQRPSWPQGTQIIKLMNKAKGIRLMLAGWQNHYCPDSFVAQQGVLRLIPLIRQRTRWFQGHLTCWRHIPALLARRGPVIARTDTIYYLLAPVLVFLFLPSSILFVFWSIYFLATGATAVAVSPWSYLPALVVWYLFSFGALPTVVWTFWREEKGMSAPRAFLWAHLFSFFYVIWFIAGCKAVYRMARGEGSWAKTARTKEPGGHKVESL